MTPKFEYRIVCKRGEYKAEAKRINGFFRFWKDISPKFFESLQGYMPYPKYTRENAIKDIINHRNQFDQKYNYVEPISYDQIDNELLLQELNGKNNHKPLPPPKRTLPRRPPTPPSPPPARYMKK